ncbi:MAG: hypothetical protein KGO81_04060 [Bacteroidota bacterium]|nr:hypothetical protein [Bacteroidota bacterium]
MQTGSFNVTDVMAVLQHQWKKLFVFVSAAMLITVITLLIVPRYYKAETVVMPANVTLADKSRLFSERLQSLHSFLGNEDDLETLYGISKLDTFYNKLVSEFDLVQYYNVSGENTAIKKFKVAKALRKDIEFLKSEYNQLVVTVWMKDKFLAVNIANRAVEIIQETEQQIWKENYAQVNEELSRTIASSEKRMLAIADSLKNMEHSSPQAAILFSRQQELLAETQQYQKLSGEIKIAIATAAPALYVIQKASPAAYAERPKIMQTLIAVFFASIVFGAVALLVFQPVK